MNQQRKYFPQIDALRFFAVSLVIISHWLPNHWINSFQLGRIGVDIFFVISGFLITRILFLLRENPSPNLQKWKTFFIRRILRIFPAYYFVVLVTLVNRGVFEEAIFWNLAYGSNFFIIGLDAWPGTMSHFWSLSVEEHFYLFWPFVILLPLRKYLLQAILWIVAIGVLSRLYFFTFDYSYFYSYIFTTSCFDAFAIGGLLAYLYYFHFEFLLQKVLTNWWLLVLFIGLFSFSLYSINYQGYNDNIWNVVCFRLITAGLFFLLIGKAIHSNVLFLNHPALVWLGKLSYSMYLFHNFIPGFLLGIEYPANIYLRIGMYFPVLILVSYISYKWVEMPFNTLKQRFKY